MWRQTLWNRQKNRHSRESGNPVRKRRIPWNSPRTSSSSPKAGSHGPSNAMYRHVADNNDGRALVGCGYIRAAFSNARPAVVGNAGCVECRSSMRIIHGKRRYFAPCVGQGFTPAQTQMRDEGHWKCLTRPSTSDIHHQLMTIPDDNPANAEHHHPFAMPYTSNGITQCHRSSVAF